MTRAVCRTAANAKGDAKRNTHANKVRFVGAPTEEALWFVQARDEYASPHRKPVRRRELSRHRAAPAPRGDQHEHARNLDVEPEALRELRTSTEVPSGRGSDHEAPVRPASETKAHR